MKRIFLLLTLFLAVAMAKAVTFDGLYQDFKTGSQQPATITFDFSWIEVEQVAQPWSYNVFVTDSLEQKIVNLWFNSGSHFQYQHQRGENSQNVYMFVPSGPQVSEYMMVDTTIEPMSANGQEEAAILEIHFIDDQGQEIARFSRAWSRDLAQRLYQSLNEAIGMLNMQPYQSSPSFIIK